MTIMLIGPRSTQDVTYGMSIGFDLLISGFVARDLPHIVINRSEGMSGREVGKFSLGGALATFKQLASFYKNLLGVGVIYTTIGISHAGFFRDALLIWPAWLFGKRIVLHLKGGGFSNLYEDSSSWVRFLMRHTLARADTIIVLGELLRDQFEFVPGIEQKLRVVRNGLPTELQNSSVEAKSLETSQPLKLLYLSNMIVSKGYLDVLAACAILHNERHIPIHCDFCGAFIQTVNDEAGAVVEARARFQEQICEHGLEGIVTYHGTVRGDEKQKMLQEAHIFLLPTSYPWEGQPISVIEALAFGTPVISTRYRGIPEQVKDGYNGFLIAPNAPHEIADVVEKLWHDLQLYHQLSQNALMHFQEYFTQEAHLNCIIPVILGL